MTKKVLIFLIILALTLGGFFYWQKKQLTPSKEWTISDVIEQKDYIIEENEEKLVIKHVKSSFSFQLDKEWTYSDQNVYISSSDITFYSPDSVINQETNTPKNGCKITLQISDVKIDAPTLENRIKEKFTWDSIIFNEYKNERIGGHESIRHIFEDEKLQAHFVGVHIPTDNKLFEILLEAGLRDKEKCKDEFEEALKTISFKK